MGKPVITNIRPPVTPPKTSFVLGEDSLGTDYFALNSGASAAQFDILTGKIDWTGTGLDADDYGYVFLAANSKDDLTVKELGPLVALDGIIATGNGKDLIDLSNSLGDNVIFSGNGMDTVVGGAGDDIIYTGNGPDRAAGGNGDDQVFGENGPDTLHGDKGNDYVSGGEGPDRLFGDANNDTVEGGQGTDTVSGGTDDGQFEFTQSEGLTLTGNVYTGEFGEVDQGNADGFIQDSGKNAGDIQDNSSGLHQLGYVQPGGAGGDVYQVFDFSPKDLPVIGTDDAHDFVAVVFAAESGGTPLAYLDFHLDRETDVYVFKFDLSDPALAGGGKVFVYEGSFADLTQDQLDDPQGEGLGGLQPLHALADVTSGGDAESGPNYDSLVVGDVLAGGSEADVFVYRQGSVNDGVDEITDYSQAEGDVLQLELDGGTTAVVDNANVHDGSLFIFFKDSGGGYVADAAIKLDGITDISQVTINQIIT